MFHTTGVCVEEPHTLHTEPIIKENSNKISKILQTIFHTRRILFILRAVCAYFAYLIIFKGIHKENLNNTKYSFFIPRACVGENRILCIPKHL